MSISSQVGVIHKLSTQWDEDFLFSFPGFEISAYSRYFCENIIQYGIFLLCTFLLHFQLLPSLFLRLIHPKILI